MILIFVGTAGSGKTTLTGEFGKYLEENGYSVGYVNLDTGAEKLPYKPDVDVREDLTVWELLKKGYGPNGAIVESYELLMPRLMDYTERIIRLHEEKDYVLLDTPGQVEVFLFHEFGVKLVESLPEPLSVYLFGPEILRGIHDFCFVHVFATLIGLRLGTVTVPALSKVDSGDSVEDYRKFLDNPDYLTARLKFEASTQGLLAYNLCSALSEVLAPVRTLYLSAKKRVGFEDLETLAHEHRCTCGDLT